MAVAYGHFFHDVYNLSAAVVMQAAVFLPLAYLIPGKKSQPVFRRDMITDLLYYFIAGLVIAPLNVAFLNLLTKTMHVPQLAIAYSADGKPLLFGWSLALHFVIAIFMVDFIQYWMHRWLHTGTLWKIHSIHHSSPNVDWLSNNRTHPINYVIFICVGMDIATLCGFDPFQSLWVIIFYGINSCLVHANLHWTYGPLRYVFSSPVFHRWHHTSVDLGGNKNFSAVFSFIDYTFGTFYMPEGQLPQVFGTPDDPVPENILGQIAYPFRKPKALPASNMPDSVAVGAEGE